MERIHSYQRRFVADREWERFHTPKNLACALSVEAGELLEIFQWMDEAELAELNSDSPRMQKINEELADVFYYLSRLADTLGIDLETAFWNKTRQNEAKYPVELAKGNAKKYTELKKMKAGQD